MEDLVGVFLHDPILAISLDIVLECKSTEVKESETNSVDNVVDDIQNEKTNETKNVVSVPAGSDNATPAAEGIAPAPETPKSKEPEPEEENESVQEKSEEDLHTNNM